jgi:putative tricarboxylic transport membrane protein
MDDRGGAAGPSPDGPTAPTWTVELVVAGLLALTGGVVMADSLRVGTGWGAEGPQAGFFPFYVGLILFASAATTFALGLAPALRPRENFVGRRELGRVMGLLVPAAVFVAAANWLGLYVPAALLIAFFTRAHGGFGLAPALGLGAAISLVLFAAFELWLLMPLPKGPLEAALGF